MRRTHYRVETFIQVFRHDDYSKWTPEPGEHETLEKAQDWVVWKDGLLARTSPSAAFPRRVVRVEVEEHVVWAKPEML